eukprot:130331_1
MWLTVFLVNLACEIILCLLVCYHLVKYFKRKKLILIIRRYPKLVYTINILSCLFIIIHRPIFICVRLSLLSEINPTLHVIFWRISSIVYVCTGYSAQILLSCRFWLMLNDINYCNSTANKLWKHYIDPNVVECNFWLKNKNRFGSFKYSLSISICCWLIISVIYVVTRNATISYSAIDDNYKNKLEIIILFIDVLMWILSSFLPTVMICMVPKILDIFYLRYEMKMYVFSVWITTTFMAISLLIANNIMLTESSGRIAELIVINAATIASVIVTLSTTFFVLNKMETPKNAADSENSMKYNHQNIRQLNDALLNHDIFELFMHHLCLEFSMELMLCFIEMLQYKFLIFTTFSLNQLIRINTTNSIVTDHNDGFFDFTTFDFTAFDVPKSHLVHNRLSDNETDLRIYLNIAHDLYIKYLDENADLCINISGDMRSAYDDMKIKNTFIENNCNSMEPIELFEHFDPIIEELYQCLLISFDRFGESNKSVNVGRIALQNMDSVQVKRILAHQQ